MPSRPRNHQCGSRPAIITGKAAASREASDNRSKGTHRGSGSSTRRRGKARNKGSLLGRRTSRHGVRERSTREGEDRLEQMADGSVVPKKPGNSGRGKGPC